MEACVPQPDLLERLSDVLRPGMRLALVCAPAGYGKTTLVSEWIHSIQSNPTSTKFAWFSLEESDNDPLQYFTYLTTAIQEQCPTFGEQSRGLIGSSQQFSPQTAARILIQDLVDINSNLVIVLDDYHLIHSRSIHEGMAELLDHLPPHIHLVFTTRSDPPFPVHRYRARGQLIEIRQGDLRFNQTQIYQFILKNAHKQLTGSELDILEQRTEGWPAGLQMAAFNLQHSTGTREFLEALSGNQQYILDYLSEEVFKIQPEPVQRFLLVTSLLDRFCAPLCDELLSEYQLNSQEIIQYISTSNLFLVQLDSERTWFRYHHLFRDLLRARLKSPAAMDGFNPAVIHGRAADWYEKEGWHNLAIQHYISAKQYDQAASLVEKYSVQLFAQGMLSQLLSWIRQLPPELADQRPWLCVYQAWAVCFSGQNPEVFELLQKAELAVIKISNEQEKQKIRYEINAIRSMVAITSGDVAKTFELTSPVQLPPDSDGDFAYSVLLWSKGYAHRMAGDVQAASGLFKQVVEIGLRTGNAWTILSGSVDYGNSLRLLGHLNEAEQVFRTGMQKVQQTRQGQGFIGRLESFLAAVLYEKNELEEAYHLAKSGIEHNRIWENPNHMVYGNWVLARIYLGIGNLEEAEKLITIAEEGMQSALVVPPLRAGVQSTRLRIWLRNGQTELAQQWVTDHPVTGETINEVQYLYGICAARVFMSTGQKTAAYSILRHMAETALASGLTNSLIETTLLSALSAPDPISARRHLVEALQTGLPLGYQRIYLDEGLAVVELIDHVLANVTESGLSTQLIHSFELLREKFPVEPKPAMNRAISAGLTKRELEILKWVGEGLSNQEIGKKLFISAGTVKAHTASIFRKLDANNRAEAVSRAKDLDLI